MAKELPFFKFEPSEWDNGNIQMCSREAKGLFIDLCSIYWSRVGDLPYALALQKYCNGDTKLIEELSSNDIIIVEDGKIHIEFLAEQLTEFEDLSEKRRKAAEKRWGKSKSDAIALQEDSTSNARREEKRREEERREEDTKRFVFKTALIDYGFKKDLVNDWLKVRAKKRLSDTKTAFDGFIKELEKKECDINTVLKTMVENSWGGFKWSWMNQEQPQKDSIQNWD